MPEFTGGVKKTARATMTNPVAKAFDYSATLYMGVNMVAMANAGFHLEAGESKQIELPTIMPAEPGVYPVFIDVWSNSAPLGHYKAVEDVIILAEEPKWTVSPVTTSTRNILTEPISVGGDTTDPGGKVIPTFSGYYVAYIDVAYSAKIFCAVQPWLKTRVAYQWTDWKPVPTLNFTRTVMYYKGPGKIPVYGVLCQKVYEAQTVLQATLERNVPTRFSCVFLLAQKASRPSGYIKFTGPFGEVVSEKIRGTMWA